MTAGSLIRSRPAGAAMSALALAGLLISLYLAIVKLAGGSPICGPLAGCDTVNNSEYAVFMGIPVALFGAGASAVTLAGALAWWRASSRRGLLVAYLVGLAGLPVLAYLTYLELFVIHAVCIWCVAYAVTVVGGWVVATGVLFARPPDSPEPGQ